MASTQVAINMGKENQDLIAFVRAEDATNLQKLLSRRVFHRVLVCMAPLNLLSIFRPLDPVGGQPSAIWLAEGRPLIGDIFCNYDTKFAVWVAYP
jgi:hypothetical protein